MENTELELLQQELWDQVWNHHEADHRLVNRIIFHGVPSNTPRGYRDVFTDHEILHLASLECVYTVWPRPDRDWLVATVDTIDALKQH